MTTLVTRSSLILGAVGLVAATAGVIGSSSPAPVSALALSSPVALSSPFAATRPNATASTRAASARTSQRYREVTIPAGTRLSLRVGSSYSSASSHVEQAVNATVVSAVHANGVTALPAGSRVSGIDYAAPERAAPNDVVGKLNELLAPKAAAAEKVVIVSGR